MAAGRTANRKLWAVELAGPAIRICTRDIEIPEENALQPVTVPEGKEQVLRRPLRGGIGVFGQFRRIPRHVASIGFAMDRAS